jgi:hypothetical protein
MSRLPDAVDRQQNGRWTQFGLFAGRNPFMLKIVKSRETCLRAVRRKWFMWKAQLMRNRWNLPISAPARVLTRHRNVLLASLFLIFSRLLYGVLPDAEYGVSFEGHR